MNLAGVTHKALADYQGVLLDAFAAALPRAQVTAVVVEFGTLERKLVQRANMAGRWLRYHGAKHPALARKVHAEFCEAFYPSDAKWRAAALEARSEVHVARADGARGRKATAQRERHAARQDGVDDRRRLAQQPPVGTAQARTHVV